MYTVLFIVKSLTTVGTEDRHNSILHTNIDMLTMVSTWKTKKHQKSNDSLSHHMMPNCVGIWAVQ